MLSKEEAGREENKGLGDIVKKLEGVKSQIDKGNEQLGARPISWADLIVIAAKATTERAWIDLKVSRASRPENAESFVKCAAPLCVLASQASALDILCAQIEQLSAGRSSNLLCGANLCLLHLGLNHSECNAAGSSHAARCSQTWCAVRSAAPYTSSCTAGLLVRHGKSGWGVSTAMAAQTRDVHSNPRPARRKLWNS